MRFARTKNTLRNIAFGAVNRVINIVLPFLARTVILYVMGTQYLGLSSLFASVLSFLSLTELGIGAAMVYSMYKPIAENDHALVKALLNLYRKLYRIIGTVILAIGLLLMPVLRILVPEELPSDINLYLLYFIYLINAVLSYWLFAYKNALLQAYQRDDINSKIASIITPASYAVMLLCLFLTKNYYAYVIWLPVFTILTNFSRRFLASRTFPDMEPEGEVSSELKRSIFKKTAALIGTKLNTVVLNAADNLVMSAFLGLTVIAMYGNYHYIMTAVTGFTGIIYASMTAGLGNSLQTDSLDTNYRNFEKFSFINSWLVGWCTVCLVCLYQPFMEIWVGKSLMFPFYVVLEMGLYFYIYQIRKIPVVYKDAAGIWWEDRFRPYVCMVVNLVLNLVLVQIIGISGIILSTVFSLFVSIPWENVTIFKHVFHRSSKSYYKKMLFSAAAMLLAGAVTFWICSLLEGGVLMFLLRMCVCVIVPNVTFALCSCKRPEFGDTMVLVRRILRRQF